MSIHVSQRSAKQWAGNKCPTPFVRSTRRAAPRQKGSDTYFPLDPNSKRFAAILASFVLVAGPSAVAAEKVTFEQHVKPILRQHCLNCHHAGDARGGLAMDSYSSLLEGGGSGEIVYDDGDAEASRLWQLVNHDDTPVMPPSKVKVPAPELAILRAWIEGGILENDGSVAPPKSKNALASVAPTSPAESPGPPAGGPVMPIATIPQTVPVATDRPAAVTAIAASPWAPLVAIAGQRQIVLYHTQTHQLLGVLPFEEGVAQSIRFSVDGSHLIVGGGQHSVRGIAAIYDVHSGQRVATIGDDLDTIFDADIDRSMRRVAMGGPQARLRIYDATDGAMLWDLDKHTDWIYCVAFSPDGVLIASGDRSGGLHLWEAGTGRLYMDLTGHQGAVQAVAWRDDSNVLASAGEDGSVRLWNVSDGKLLKKNSVGKEAATSLDFDHAGHLLVGTAGDQAFMLDSAGNTKSKLPAMPDDVLEVSITHDNNRAIYGSWNGDIVSIDRSNHEDKVSLASNPPTVQRRLIGIEASIAKIQSRVEDARAVMVEVGDRHRENQTKLQQHDDAAGQLSNQSKHLSLQIGEIRQTIDQTLATIDTQQSVGRDLSDKLVAARVHSSDDPTAQSIIGAEQSLVAHLSTLVASRQSVIDARQTLAETQQKIAAQKIAIEAHAQERPALADVVTKTEAELQLATSDLETAVEELRRVESKRNFLSSKNSL